ncbi:PepSY domain-containing protein [Rodentibacter trehalosifermentans]|uniref:PepSY domain-containing protein n=1 Tax=Rodentibacter trehalosifermentans TaxID=1908263 RepID=UPI0009843462|nr:PepSY domain-containing protein [Rodentibacter trehalosifermentans]OOF47805.1 hypothetical protein BKK53_10810 [Rodentibacter trehalosifermentans]
MKKVNKTILAALLTGAMTLGVMNTALAMSPEAQEALAKTQITASQALSAAQNKIGADAKVKEVEFHHTKYGKDYFEVDLIANNQHHKVDVDAANGEILGMTSKTPKKVKVRAEQNAPKITFEQAMNIAVEKTGGKVAEADLKFRDRQGFYKIETLANGQRFDIVVNGENGQIMDMPKHKGNHKERHGKGKYHYEEGHRGGFHAEHPTQKN